MFAAILLSFFSGLLGGNAIPHFVKGITKESYPMAFGNGPIPNLLSGWFCFILSAVLFTRVDWSQYPMISFISFALGLLLIGLFHAGHGAVGKKEK
ncbi:MAG: hypothetical protein AAB553_01520 [Patescibacteria group bacterium]